ncbi:chaplin [Streptomyces sp. NPDC048361]|uniref:chaplin n=1 Tax=Streptomyces sp. NPDC048361 TaxID=3154720 RepID=UPI0034353156
MKIRTLAVMAALVAGATLGGAGTALADSHAEGVAVGSPGVGSGNVVQIPVHVQVNFCGNSIGAAAALNPAFGNTCVNG